MKKICIVEVFRANVLKCLKVEFTRNNLCCYRPQTLDVLE